MNRALAVVLLAIVLAALTWMVGWWSILLAAGVAGAVGHRQHGYAGLVAAAAALAWTALLLVDARDGRLMALATQLGGVFSLPGVALLLLAVAFAAAGAWSAAVVSAGMAQLLTRSRRAAAPPGE